MGWLMSMIFAEANESVLEWIFATISLALKYCSEYENELFRFVPELYMPMHNIGTHMVLLLPD